VLQWGHGISAVDTSIRVVLPVALSPLQWGHGISAVDTVPLKTLLFKRIIGEKSRACIFLVAFPENA